MKPTASAGKAVVRTGLGLSILALADFWVKVGPPYPPGIPVLTVALVFAILENARLIAAWSLPVQPYRTLWR